MKDMDEKEMADAGTASNGSFKVLAKGLAWNVSHNLKRHVSFILGFLLLLVGIVAANYYYQYQLARDNPQKIAQEESRNLLAAVSKLIVLPDNEEPTIATVSDPEALKGQAFFTNAKKGDKVLIYTNARKAILYSPETNKIIEVAPLTIGSPTK